MPGSFLESTSVMDVELKINPERGTSGVYASHDLRKHTVIPEASLIRRYGNISHTPEKYLRKALKKMHSIKIEGCDCDHCLDYVRKSHPFYNPISKAIRLSK